MLSLCIAQINPVVGDVEGNLKKIKEICEENHRKVHLVVFPELSLSGYSPEDYLLREDFISACMNALEDLRQSSLSWDCVVAVGSPFYRDDLYNALVVFFKGRVYTYFKSRLPNYGVFDEERYFRKGTQPLILEINGTRVAFSICEDIWYPDGTERVSFLSGAQVLVNVNASPFEITKYRFREGFLRARAQDNIGYVVYVNLVGGQDELVFDGRSMVLDPLGDIIARGKAFEEDLLFVTLDTDRPLRRRLVDLRWRNASSDLPLIVQPSDRINLSQKETFEPRLEPSPKDEEELYSALVLGTRDYVLKNGFKKAVIGLSGGIDSSLTACVAVDALGRDNVMGLFMPSRFSSQESYEDAKELAQNLGIEFHTVPIDETFSSYLREIMPAFGELDFDTADENLQARIRANILFYVSNKFGYVVLSTSNKSESATGYTTVYGDMAGGFAPLKDVYKTQVYKLARWRNSLEKVIPERVFEKPPSAELRPNQRDQDTLPPYEELDGILKLYIEENLGLEEIVKRGFDKDTVAKVIRMIRSSEYKRHQAPIGIKVTPRAFGKDWRFPVTGRFTF